MIAADLSGLDPRLRTAVERVVAGSKGRVRTVSGVRTWEAQGRLWMQALTRYGSAEAAYQWVRPPGHSMHERGLAVDLGGDLVLADALAKRLSLPIHRPFSHEPWHFELQPAARATAAVGVKGDEEALARGVQVVFTDRTGGVSQPPFHWLNLAMRVGDRQQDVAENRRRLATAAGFEGSALALSRQVHGTTLLTVEGGQSGVVGEADGLLTRTKGVVLGLLTADCAAVVLAGDGVVGMVHAGWRGLAAGVIERAMLALAPVWGAWVGPAIRACCYEVGQDVVEAFRANDLPLARPNHVDIVDAARVVLLRSGVQRITVNEDCTGCQDRYFSFRRERVTGRQGTFVWMIGA